MAFDKAKFLTRFVDEAREHISRLNEGLQELEKNPDDREILNGIFRSAHTIKGSARMMKLIPVSEVAHNLEDVLDAFRQKKIPPSKSLSDLLYQGIDSIDSMLDRIAAGDELTETPREICRALAKAAQELLQGNPPMENGFSEEPAPGFSEQSGTFSEKNPENPLPDPKEAEEISAKASEDTSPKKKTTENSPAESLQKQGGIKSSGAAAPPKTETVRNETIRIDAEKLDELIKLMGEIVSGHSRTRRRVLDIREIEKLAEKNTVFLSHLPEDRPLSLKQREEIRLNAVRLGAELKKLSAVFKEDISIQGILTNDLQDKSLKMRMLPLATIFNSFHRTVRHISRGFGKDVDFIVEGGETELDKKIIEKISDPLIHMIRNSIDHGIEKAEDRVRAGKSGKGSIRLSAGYEGENVVIGIRDDGAGIPVQKIKAKALKKKFMTPSEIENTAESEIINLIFRPGFSSRDIVTDISGRGVGMDVVRKNIIDDLKGAIRVETEEGGGTFFQIRLPLTIAVIHVLFIRVSGMVFAVPANYISEILRHGEDRLIRVTDRRAIRLREQIIPIVYLRDILALPGEKKEDADTEYLILICSVGNEKLGVIIDALLDEEDMVIKPLPAHMRHIRFVSGCIISGRNEIFNVLHMPHIIENAKDVRTAPRPEAMPEKKSLHILVADDSVSTREIEKSILESHGYSVTLAGDGHEAYEKARKNNYDLIVSDVEMPRMDGFSLTEKLRKDENCKDIPIILVTSLDKESDKKKGIQIGADAYIVKGDFEQSALLETVRNLLG